MKQPIKGGNSIKRKKPLTNKKRKHKDYGTSKLELYFAKEYLDKMGLKYIYQFEAKDMKRFYDFAIMSTDKKDYIMETKDGLKSVKQDGQTPFIDLLIEVDGGYYHSDPRIVKEDKLNPMQKHNKFVDKLKDTWAGMHCIPLLRLWEEDIRNNPKFVKSEITKYVKDCSKKRMIKENKNKPH